MHQRRLLIHPLEGFAFFLRNNRLAVEGYIVKFAFKLRNIHPVFKKGLHKPDAAHRPCNRPLQQPEIEIVIIKPRIGFDGLVQHCFQLQLGNYIQQPQLPEVCPCRLRHKPVIIGIIPGRLGIRLFVHLQTGKQVRHFPVKSIDFPAGHNGVARKLLLVERIGVHPVLLRIEDIERALQRVVGGHRLCLRVDVRMQEHIETIVRNIPVKIAFQGIAPLLFHILRTLAEETLGPRIMKRPSKHFHFCAAQEEIKFIQQENIPALRTGIVRGQVFRDNFFCPRVRELFKDVIRGNFMCQRCGHRFPPV
ncbi:MAG: hypothetical protein DELT_03148 [Desulfovibrio sp.]